MVRFINKNLKSHYYENKEKLSDFLDFHGRWEFVYLLKSHLKDFGKKSPSDLLHFSNKLMIELGMGSLEKLNDWIGDNHSPKTKEVFLFLDLVLETYNESRKRWMQEQYLLDFINDFNELFLINKSPLQIKYFPVRNEFYIEKIISPEVSEKIKETLESFSKEGKVFEDFKEAIKSYSSGYYERAIEKCCISIEDYLCVILDKKTCSSVDTYYKEVSKKFNIPSDLDNRFSNIISFIHKYRSHQNHGAIEKKDIPEPELTTQVVIQFTMTILNYLKKRNERLNE